MTNRSLPQCQQDVLKVSDNNKLRCTGCVEMYLHDIANATGLVEDLHGQVFVLNVHVNVVYKPFGATMYVQCKLDRNTLDNK